MDRRRAGEPFGGPLESRHAPFRNLGHVHIEGGLIELDDIDADRLELAGLLVQCCRECKGKVFASLDDHHHGAEHLSVWVPAGPGAQQGLIESDPKRYFRPPYVGSAGWVGIVLDDEPDWAVVAWLVEQAYRLVAARTLVARLDAAR